MAKASSGGVRSKGSRTLDKVLFVVLALGAVIMVFPLFYMIMCSFMTKNQILSADFSVIPNPWKFGMYSEVLHKGLFLSGIRNSLTVALPVLVVGGFTSSLAAFSFAKLRFKGANVLFLHTGGSPALYAYLPTFRD